MSRPDGDLIDVSDYGPLADTMRSEVLRGLSQDPKVLPSHYLYDERGARLFERICETDEYYLTRTELEVLEQNLEAITSRIGPRALVIEPGSGSGVKTHKLLEGLEEPAGYIPIDVARRQLEQFATETARAFPDLEVMPVCADFTADYKLPNCPIPVRSRVSYLPGSTIGNFEPGAAVKVLDCLAELCDGNGGLLVGVDLKKDRKTLEAAYDDAEGVSREFALNYLVRLNRELGADFQIDQFDYEAPYNEELGRIEMALISLCDQSVRVDGTRVSLKQQERLRTEFSYKHTLLEFAALAEKARLCVEQIWTDPNNLFSVQYLERG